MKKQNLKSLMLNRKVVSNFTSDTIYGAGAHSGLDMTCPNFCVITKNDGPLCNPDE